MKKVLIVSSSPRRGGNSDLLCEEFRRGASEAGNEVEKISLKDYRINYCSGCGVCNARGVCSQKDDAEKLAQRMISADVIVLATPVYFYSMCGQLKVAIDRMCAYYTKIVGKEFYYILTAADTNEGAMRRTVEGLRGFVEDCLPGAEEKGILLGVGAWGVGEIKDTPAFSRAFEMGKNV